MNINSQRAHSIGLIRASALLALALTTTSCLDSLGSQGLPDDSVSNGSFGVTDGTPFVVTGPQGGPFPEGSRTYTLVNFTPGLFRWDLDSPEPWLTSAVLGGALGPMNQTEVTLTLDSEYAASLPVGEYPADIVFTDRDDPNGTLVMAFLLTVEPPPSGDLTVGPDVDWQLEALEAATLDGESRTYTVTNASEGTLHWAASTAEPWLMLEGNTSGELEPGESADVPVTFHAAGLEGEADLHFGSVLFQNDGDPADQHESLVQVRLGDGVSTRVNEGLVAQYSFEEASGTTIHDEAGALNGLDLEIEDPALTSWGPGSLILLPGARIGSSGPATELTQALTAANELTLEAWIAPENTTQEGPARIISLSGGASTRNVTLGQGLWGGQPSDSFNVRLRSSDTDMDGQPMLNTGAGAASIGLQHVIYTRAQNGATRIFVNGVVRANGATLGDLDNWDDGFRLLLGNESGVNRSWSGRLHLVALYDRALSAGEVVQNFEAGTGDATGPLLVATPGTGLTASGEVGGSIAPTSQTYTLSNGGSEVLAWEAAIDGAIAFIDGPLSGTLQPDETVSLSVQLDESVVGSLSAGSYEAEVVFTETTSGAGSTTRPITLTLEDSGSTGSGGSSDSGGSTDYGEKPGAHNTGPYAPELLVPSGSITVTQDGAVIENVAVTGNIRVEANDVTIRNFTIDGQMSTWYGIEVESDTSGLVLESGEITGVNSAAVLGSNFSADRLHLHHLGKDAFKTSSNVTISRSYVHHIGMNPGTHADGNQTRGGGNILLRANNFELPSPAVVDGLSGFASNACSINQAETGNIDGFIMEGNWLNGGNYTVFFTTNDKYHTGLTFTGAQLINNQFGRDYQFGPLRVNGDVIGFISSGNRWEDTGELMDINNQ